MSITVAFGTSIPTSITEVGDEYVVAPVPEFGHDGILVP